jgi:circadian clock protein KaiC
VDQVAKDRKNNKTSSVGLAKCATGIEGLDEITGGGLPLGRPTLVAGAAGCGKTLLAMEFIVRGASVYDEPGVFVAFEETPEELAQNTDSIGFNLKELIAKKKVVVDHVYIERSEMEETGEYDLEGLFVRLAHAIDSVGAKRVALDTIEVLFSGFSNASILRAELRRLFRWLKNRGVTVVITGERGEGTVTRQGLEEYVSDCVIILDQRVENQISTRRLRIVKYRGSGHGADEYPFLVTETGISVLPISSLKLDYPVSAERISTGIPSLDAMLGGKGYFRGSSILASGTAGSGKTSLAAHFVDAACRRGERCLYFAFEESPRQIMRNMRSIGIHLEHWANKGLLRYHAVRPTLYGLETHLVTMHRLIEEFEPKVIVMDPFTNFMSVGTLSEANSMLTRLIDFFKSNRITALFISLTSGGDHRESTGMAISSLMDTWILLRDMEANGERSRGIYVLKSRGMAHSNQIREFQLTGSGIQLADAYLGPEGVLTGTARLAQEARDRAKALADRQEIERKKRELGQKRKVLDAQIAGLQTAFESEEEELKRIMAQKEKQEKVLAEDSKEMGKARQADPVIKLVSTRKKGGVK